ncbi:MAG TPA: ROK family protein, partial [Anaerolineaceae bacterium]|nr:ROK family protein [Anaerolineaceae bacterium]
IDAVSSDMVFDANETGDALAGEVIRNAAAALGIAVGTLVNIFNPDLVVIGGGVGERGDVFLQPVRVVARENMLRPECETPIKTAALGNLAGVSGSAALTGFAGKNR